MIIKEVFARKIRDSRNEATIEVSVNGQKASSPSGKSKGEFETPSYRKSLSQSITDINSLSRKLSNFNIDSFSDLLKVESFIKKQFKLKSAKQFGANSLFALESATLKALAKSKGKELWQIINPHTKKIPIPLGNAVGGGVHSYNKHRPEFQEFLIIPKWGSMEKNVRVMNNVYSRIKSIIKTAKINDEGALQTSLNNEQILKLLSRFKSEVKIGIDAAASAFYKNNNYCYKNKSLGREEQIRYINSLIKDYNIFYVEDPLEENDFSGFSKISKKALICGDDLTATNIQRLKRAISKKSMNAMIVKPNQNGSLLDVAEVIRLCKKHGIKIILSHRSGETLDSAIADYAFAFQADYIKMGIKTKWREAKLRRLIEIEKFMT